MSEDIRMCSRDDLVELAKRAKRHRFNRQTSIPRLEVNLDPDGVNVLSILLWGHNVDHAPVLHHRVRVLAKMTGADGPTVFQLDVADTDWQELRPIPESAKESS
jgi:hypothetical protein